MHWTAILSRKHHAPGAMVIGDLPCSGCGYNLRGVRAMGRCPECGASVSDSLRVLRRPQRVASALRGLAWSVGGLASAGLIVVGAAWSMTGPTWLGFGLLLCFSVYRAFSVYELRYRCALENLPTIGARLGALFWLSLLELALLATGTVLVYVASLTFSPIGAVADELVGLTAAGWLVAVIAAAFVIGSLGTALAAILGYGFVEREFAIQRVIVLVGAVGGAALVLLGFVLGIALTAPAAVRVVSGIALGLVVLAAATAMGFTIVGLLHLAAASERDLDVRDEVIGGDDTARADRPPPEELPPISLEGDER